MMKNHKNWLGKVFALAIPVLAGATPQASAQERDARSAAAPAAQIATPPRLNIELGAGVSFSANTVGPAAILSPDGAVMVFVAQKAAAERPQLYVRKLDQSRDMPLAGTEGADSPFFSPDGKWIAFFADGNLKKTPMGGGAPITICKAGSADGNARGGSWAEDGTIFFSRAPRTELSRVSSAGGSPAPADEARHGNRRGHAAMAPGTPRGQGGDVHGEQPDGRL